jgi:RNA polymerase sigma-70 factor (ECF subfamily)
MVRSQMAWQTAGPFCFLIDCWQSEGRLNAWVAKCAPQPLTIRPCKFFALAAYYLMEALRPGRMSSPGIAEPTEAIARAKAGDAQAWGQLYHDYAPAIFRFCRRALPTREDAEDATMEVFMKLKGKINQYDSSRPFSGWLYKVAANHCWDTLRRRKIRQDKETEDSEELPLEHPDPSQLDRLIEQRSSAEVRKALACLSKRARMALVMRYYSDMSYDEIADELGVRRAFVGVVLLRARHELRNALEGNAALAAGGNA